MFDHSLKSGIQCLIHKPLFFFHLFRMGFLLNQGGHLHSHGHGHSHSHGHGHSHGALAAPSSGSGSQQRQQGSLAVRAAFIHALGDLFQSVGVLIAAYVVRFKVPYFLNSCLQFVLKGLLRI